MRDRRDFVILALAVSTAFLAGSVLGRPGDGFAQQAPGYAGGGVAWNQKMIAATGSVGSGMSVLWLVDTESKRLLVYGTNSLGKTVELRAARRIEWDSKLDEYHDESQYTAQDLANMAARRRADDAPVTPAGGGREAPKDPPKDPVPPAPGQGQK